MSVTVINDEKDFENLVKRNKKDYVVLLISSSLCEPCKRITPRLEELAKSFEDRITFSKVDCEINDNLRQQYGIDLVPTFLLFKLGEENPAGVYQNSNYDLVFSRLEFWIGSPNMFSCDF